MCSWRGRRIQVGRSFSNYKFRRICLPHQQFLAMHPCIAPIMPSARSNWPNTTTLTTTASSRGWRQCCSSEDSGATCRRRSRESARAGSRGGEGAIHERGEGICVFLAKAPSRAEAAIDQGEGAV